MSKLSVILGTYNHMKFLNMCVDSILNQSFTDFEFIIINDGSNDGTREFLDALKDPRIKIVHHNKNEGIIPTYNKGIKLASGEYLTWVSSDNYHLPGFLESLVKALDSNPDKMFAYSGFHWIDQNAKIIRTNYEQYLGPHALLMNNPGIASFMYKRSIHDYVGYFEDVGVASDTDFWVRMFEMFPNSFVYVPKVLVYFMWDVTVDSFKRFNTTPESVEQVVKRASERRHINRITSGRRPHILFFVPNFLPDWYAGVEVYTYNLSKELLNLGFNISVAVPKIGAPGIGVRDYNGIKVFSIVSDYDIMDFRKTIENKEMDDVFIQLLDQNKFDIMHFQHLWGFPFSYIWLAKKTGYPVCVTLHDFYFICHKFYLQDNEGKIDNGPDTIDQCVSCLIGKEEKTIDEVASYYYRVAYRQANSRVLLDKVDVLTCPSKYVKDVFVKRGFGTKMEISELGIPEMTITKSKITKFVFGYFGVINPLKRVEELISVFKEIKSNEIELVIWGQGRVEYIDKLKDLIKEDKRISYRGPYTPVQLPRILSEIDIFVNPSLNESFSFTTREAISAGVPVIARKVGAIEELSTMVSGGVDYLFENLDQLKECIERSIIDSYEKRTLRAIKKKLKTIEQDANKWIERYRRLL